MMKHKMIILLAIITCAMLAGQAAVSQERDLTSVSISRLDFENADIRQVIKTLSEIGNRNIVLDKNVEGECTVYLSDITWEAALLAVLNMNDLVGYEDNGFIKVMQRSDYDSQIEQLEARRKIEKLEQPKRVKVVKIHHARAEDIKRTLDPLLGEEDQPSVDLRTNSLVFTATDSSLAVIDEIVQDLDAETRQVSIEVKMVSVDSNSLTEIGVNWKAEDGGNQGIQESILEEGKLFLGKYSGTIDNTTLEATVAALIDKQKAEIVSRPHITTQDNEPANISSGKEVPIVTYDEARNTVIEFADASTELMVTPHILTDDRILLDVDAARRTAEGVGVGLQINEEQAQVKMIVTNGQTAVIGGLRQRQDSTQDNGIPVLQDIPLVGQLFKYSKVQTKNTDLIIFITPRIVSNVETRLTERTENNTGF